MPLSKRILPHGKKSLNANSPNYYTATGTLDGNNILTGTTNSGSKTWTANLSALAGGGGVTSPLTTKGDIWVFSTDNARLPVGSNGQVLKADSGETLGLKWAAPTDTPAGSNQEIQYNDDGSFGAIATLKYDGTNINQTAGNFNLIPGVGNSSMNITGSLNVSGTGGDNIVLRNDDATSPKTVLIRNDDDNATIRWQPKSGGAPTYTTTSGNFWAVGPSHTIGNNEHLVYDLGNERLGVGVDAPAYTLDVGSGYANAARLYLNEANNYIMGESDNMYLRAHNDMYFNIDTPGDSVLRHFIWRANTSSELMRLGEDGIFEIKSGGKVGIGTAGPDGKLEVIGSNGTVVVTPESDAEELVIRNNHRAGISILSSDSASRGGYIVFGGATDNNAANIHHNFDAKTFSFQGQNPDMELRFASANNVEAMRIDTSQNVGIGSTAPTHLLTVSGSNSSGDRTLYSMEMDGYEPMIQTQVRRDSSEWQLMYDGNPASLLFRRNSSTLMTLASTGKVGIGTTAPNYELDVISTDPQIALTDTNGVTYYFMSQSNHFYLHDATAGATRLFIKDGGNVGIGTTTPNELLDVSGNQKLYGHLEITGAVTDNPGNNHLWASGTGLYWGDKQVYTNIPGTSEITGGGSSGQMTYFDGTSTITGSANLTYNGSKLYVDADVQITSGEKLTIGDDENFQLYGSDGGSKYITTISEQLLIWNQDASGGPIKIQATDVTNGIQFNIAGTEQGRFTSTGLGIGTTSPDAKVEIISTTEQLRLTHTDASKYNTFTTTGDGSLEINRNGSASTDRIALLSGSNILLGRYAGHDLNSSQTGESVIIGHYAGWELKGNEAHGRHTIIGAQAAYTMSGTTDSNYILSLGAYSAYKAQTTRGFITIGNSAGYYLSGSGESPLIIGGGAGKGVALGAWGTSNGVTMSEDVLIGNGGVCEYSETLSENTIVGSRAAGFLRSGTQNVAIGRFAMRYASGSNGTTGNVAIGQSAGHGIGQFNKTNGSRYNIAIGYETQEKNLVGDRNIAIGYKVGIDGADTADDILRIGNAAGDYSFIRGDMANNNLWIGAGTPKFTISGSNVGIGTISPDYPLDVYTAGTSFAARFTNTSSNGYIMKLVASDSSLSFQTDHIIPTYNMHLGNDNVNWYIRTAGYKFGVGTSSPKTSMSLVGALSIQERADHETTNADWGQLWVKNDSPNKLYFTDDAGTDFDLTAGGGSPGGSTTQMQYNNGGAFGGVDDWTWDGTHMTIATGSNLIFGDTNRYIGESGDNLLIRNSETNGNIELNAKNDMKFFIDGAQKLHMDSLGHVGIGLTNPQTFSDVFSVQLSSNSGWPIAFTNAAEDVTGALRTDQGDNYIALASKTESDIRFFYNDAEANTSLIIKGSGATAGNVGIGTDSPAQKLQLKGDSTYFSILAADGSEGVSLGTASSGRGLFYLKGATGGNSIYLDSNGSSYLNGGNVGIGTTSPYQKLHVEGNISAQNELNFDMTTNATAYGYINWDGYQGGATQFRSLWIGDGKRGATPIAFFDGPNARVGIGTNDPQAPLHVSGNVIFGSGASSVLDRVNIGDTTKGIYGYNNRLDFYISSNPRLHLDAGTLFSDTSGGPSMDLTPGPAGTANYGFVDDTDTGMTRSAANTLHLLTAGVSGMTMDNQQRVALGTSTIHGNSRLTISQAGTSDNHGISMTSDGSNFQHIYVDANDKLILKGTNDVNLTATDDINLTAGTTTDHDIYMGSDNVLIYNANYAAQYVQFDGGTQRVGIGTTSPAEKLSIVGGNLLLGTNAKYIQFVNNGGTQFDALGYDGNNDLVLNTPSDIIFKRNGTQNVRIKSNDDFLVNTDTLYVDASEDSVGIGTTAPDDLLHVLGGDVDPSIKLENNRAGTNGSYIMEHRGSSLNLISTGSTNIPMRFTIQNTEMARIDNVGLGIGTTAPAYKLDVFGDARVKGTASHQTLELRGDTGYGAYINYVRNNGSYAFRTGMITDSSRWDITDYQGAGYEALSVTADLKVGINTTSPAATLQVAGDAKFADASNNVHLTIQETGTNGALISGASSAGLYFATDSGTRLELTGNHIIKTGQTIDNMLPYNTAAVHTATTATQTYQIESQANPGQAGVTHTVTLNLPNGNVGGERFTVTCIAIGSFKPGTGNLTGEVVLGGTFINGTNLLSPTVTTITGATAAGQSVIQVKTFEFTWVASQFNPSGIGGWVYTFNTM